MQVLIRNYKLTNSNSILHCAYTQKNFKQSSSQLLHRSLGFLENQRWVGQKDRCSRIHRLRHLLRPKDARVPGNILRDSRNEGDGSNERELVGTTVVLYGLVPVRCDGALLIIEKESSMRQGRKRENQTVISTASWQTDKITNFQESIISPRYILWFLSPRKVC